MRIGKIPNQSFKKIKIADNVYQNLLIKSSEDDIERIKNMDFKGFDYGYITADDSGLNISGVSPKRQRKSFTMHICGRPTAQKIMHAINIYNNSKYL